MREQILTLFPDFLGFISFIQGHGACTGYGDVPSAGAGSVWGTTAFNGDAGDGGGWKRLNRGPVDVWRIPYHESTLVLDIIDVRTNQMVWRGYDTRTIDFEKSEKTIHKSIEKLTKRFGSDVAKQRRRIG